MVGEEHPLAWGPAQYISGGAHWQLPKQGRHAFSPPPPFISPLPCAPHFLLAIDQGFLFIEGNEGVPWHAFYPPVWTGRDSKPGEPQGRLRG